MDGLLQKGVLLTALLETATDGVLKYWPTEDYCEMYAVENGDIVPDKTLPNWKNILFENIDEQCHRAFDRMFADIGERAEQGEYELKLLNGYAGKMIKWITCLLRYQPQEDSYYVFIKKIDDQISEKQKLFDEARRDPLTKLINKSYSTQMIKDGMERSGSGTLFIIDIDNFKSVNDNMGHLFGDEVIVSVANGLRADFRNQDLVGRIGGDEFIVFIEGLTDEEVIQKKAETVCNTMVNIYTGENDKVKISASIGIAIMPKDATEYSELFKMADHALYYTKNRGKNGFSFFDGNNEEMLKNHRILAVPEEVREVTEEVNREMDMFYFELNELAFRLLEETKDADSAINLMIHRIQEEFEFSSIRILEAKEDERSLCCTYELHAENISSALGMTYHYEESEWVKFHNFCSGDAFVYAKSSQNANEALLFKSLENVKSGVIVAISNNNCFAGVIIFEDDFRERHFSKKELKVLKSFERMFVVYKGRKLSQENTDFYLRQMAQRDNLTGLYKYHAFLEKMEEALYSIPADQKLLYVQADIAHFKYINEAHGYDMGDKILKRFAGSICGDSQYLLYGSRIHSDNLVAVFQIPENFTDQRIFDYITNQMLENNKVIQEMVSSENYYINCGIYITDSRDHQYNRAITNAGYAKKLAKENGDGRCVWFDKDMFESRKREMQLLDEFPEALRLHQFEVFYQPQIDTISKTVVGAEALSRWIRDDGTIMMPDEFIPALENSNKMIELDYYVIETVFHFIGRQYGIMEKNIPISVNLSKKHITDPDFFPRLEAMLRKYQVDPQYIFFEINEEAFISQMKETVAFCNHLNMMGIEVMMDSFGSGYSSLNVLDKLPVAYIKIDRLFIKSNAFIKNEEIILNGIVDIAKKLRKSIASMGVETFEQNAFLCKCGCDIIQGNYYSEPLPEAELIEYIREHSEPEVNTVHFTFDGTFASNNTAEYKANVNGSLITFNDQLIPGRKVLEFPGGMTSHEMIELSLGRLLENDFTVGIWFNERRVNLWTSLFCADFANGFFSIMPKGWNGLSVLRVMDKENEEFFDAIGTDKEMTGWTHIAGAYNATTHSLALFVNGFLTGYKNDVMTLKNPGRITLGGDVYQQSFDGWIADLKVTNKTMSAKDVRQVYEQEKTAYLI